MSTRTQIWIMGTTAIVTGVQAAIWLTRVPPLWPVIVLGALTVLNTAGVVAAVVCVRGRPKAARRADDDGGRHDALVDSAIPHVSSGFLLRKAVTRQADDAPPACRT